MTPFSNKQVEAVFRFYPKQAQPRMLELRELVFATAKRLKLTGALEETLKWAEPSYLVPEGSTLRMDWKEKTPEFCGLFFSCQTSLVATFRELYPQMEFEGKRCIKIPLGGDLDAERIGHCMELSLRYHAVKDLPLLGAGD